MSKYRTLDADALSVDQVKLLDQNINNILYRVTVPYMYTLSDAERAVYGSPADDEGKPLPDQEEALMSVYWPISRIIETYNSGGIIRIPSADDIKGIYTLLDEYLDIQTAILHSLFKDQYMDKVFIKKVLDLKDHLSESPVIRAMPNEGISLADIAVKIHNPQTLTATPEIEHGELRELVKFTPVV